MNTAVHVTADGDGGICLHACERKRERGCAICQMAPFPTACARTLTVGAGFVNKVTEVEEGGPGGQVLNEPLMGGKNKAEQCQ